MSLLMIILIGIGVLLLGAGIGYYLRVLVALGKIKSIEIDIKQILVGAKEEAQKIIDEAKDKAEKKLAELKEEEKKQEQELKETEKRLIKKDEFLDARQVEIDKETEKRIELERVSKLTEEEAKEELMRDIEKKYEEDILIRIQKLENSNEEKLDKRAKDILATSIQRLASSTASELMTTIVNIPNNEIKGKV